MFDEAIRTADALAHCIVSSVAGQKKKKKKTNLNK